MRELFESIGGCFWGVLLLLWTFWPLLVFAAGFAAALALVFLFS